MSKRSLVCLVLILLGGVISRGSARINTDVLHYAVTLEPDITAKSMKGSVRIRVSTTSNTALDAH